MLRWSTTCTEHYLGASTRARYHLVVGHAGSAYLVGAEVVFAGRPVGPEVDHVALLHDEGRVEELEGVGRRAVDGGADGDASLALQHASRVSAQA